MALEAQQELPAKSIDIYRSPKHKELCLAVSHCPIKLCWVLPKRGISRIPQANLPWPPITQPKDEQTGRSTCYSHLKEMEGSAFLCLLLSPAARCWADDEQDTQTLNAKAALGWADAPGMVFQSIESTQLLGFMAGSKRKSI